MITNAVTNTYEGSVTVSLKYIHFDKKLKFEVIDTGIGIKKEYQAKIFKMFSSTEQSQYSSKFDET